MPDKAFITPSVVRWARETSRFNIEEAARKINVKPEKLISWESGEASPTMKQAERMSRVYRRSLSVFYLPAPPTDFQTLRDFRSTERVQDYSPALTFIIREVQSRQAWIRDFLTEEEEEPLSFIGQFSIHDRAQDVVESMLETLDIEDDMNQQNRLKYWIKKAEQKRIFISLGSNIHSQMVFDVNEFRGFAISDPMCPVVFINTKDAPQAQLFTLVHELAHLWIHSSGVSRETTPSFREVDWNTLDPIEVFCNRIAAKLLMPEDWFHHAFQSTAITLQQVDDAAKELQLSSKAILVRLLNLGRIDRNHFYSQWSEIEQRNERRRQDLESKDKRTGFADPNLMKVRKCGYSLTNIILGSFKSGRLSASEASSLLNAKVNNFPKLERYLSP